REFVGSIETIEYSKCAGEIACGLRMAEAFGRALCRLPQVAQRARKLAPLLKVKCERGRYFSGAAAMGLLQPFTQALVGLCAAPWRQILVDDVLIQNVTESVGARICSIGPLGNPGTNQDMILPD